MKGNSVIRPFLLRWSQRQLRCVSSSSRSCESASSDHKKISSPNAIVFPANSSASTQNLHLSSPSLQFKRALSSTSGPANIVLINSDAEFEKVIKDVQGKSLDRIFYFTAVWCGPCRVISPVITELSEKFAHVGVHKIDIDQEDIGNTLRNLQISSVPTLHFYQNGKKAAEIVGADVARLKNVMETLYSRKD
ncbi:hypothetical protein K2173_020462 [Erythroxylum novogranatense]|uniref:Thioredoxin domain-containing protein n=1 Tax=Erythroxylum novogranatense TaxID=1862640 RepID=A0AAV8THT8_9ROSI|nr:hypothetical protein K2173_020462 [Erythroxylum novogranatense]